MSDASFSSWAAANQFCKACTGENLADIPFAVANVRSNNQVHHPPLIPHPRTLTFIQYWVGSYNGGALTPNLVWFANFGTVAVASDSLPRRALCDF